MQTISKFLALITLSLSVQCINAQDTIQYVNNKYKIEVLKEERTKIETQEKEYLKLEVEAINDLLEKGLITYNEAKAEKKAAAQKRALNIENRLSIIDNKTALLQRNEDGYVESNGEQSLLGFSVDSEKGTFIGVKIKGQNKPVKYDRRTTDDLVLAFGLNNALIDGEKLDDSPYKFGGSRFFELGWAWKTRVFKESNFLRFKYGFSFQFNGLKPKDNQYFVQDGDLTYLKEFSEDLKKSKLTNTNLVFPVHFEFGPSKKIEKDTYFRYSTRNQFKVGIGGYAGFNIGTRQKLKYKVDGDRTRDKIKRSYNASSLVYGLSSYIAFDDVALYVKYDLSPIFKDQTIDQNNLSIGVRFDVD